jgi:probable rRNA maturation factor
MAESRPGVSKPRRVGGDGEPEVFMADEQQDLEIDLARWQNLALDVLRAEGVKGLTEMTIMFIDASTMTELNTQYMGQSYATDVLSFPMDEIKPNSAANGPGVIGDIVLCPAYAEKNGKQSLEKELELLTVHGVLHLLGFDHEDIDDEKKMFALQEEILKEWRLLV